MRQRFFKFMSGLMILMLVIGLVYVQPVDAASVKLNKKKLSLEVGATYTLKVTGTTKTVKWSSTKKSIAKVKKGKVTAVAAGTCTIKAKVGGKTYKCKVTVKSKTVTDGVKVQSFSSMDKYSAALSKMIEGADKGVDWSALSSAEMHTDRVIVAGTPDFTGFEPKDAIKSPWGEFIIQFEDSETAQKFIKKQKKNKNVEYAEEDVFVPVSASAADTAASGLGSWGTSYVEAGILADYIKTLGIDRSVVVAVVDTGVDLDHPFLKDRIAKGGRDYVDSDNDPNDEVQGHGTHVAGTIVDCTPGLNVKILPVRVLGYNGGFVSNVSCGIRYAADQGADVINLSLGGEHAETKDAAVNYAIKKGSTVVVAAGNNSTDTSKNCPAHMKNCIVVSAIDENEERAEFSSNGGSSNYGSSVDIAAPGNNINSCFPGGKYKVLSGTSMAAPHVSAAAAMIKLMNPSFAPKDVEAYLQNNCTKDLGIKGRDDVYGYGVLKMSMAVPVSIEGISVSKLPDKTSYYVGETLETTGMELDVYYSDGRTETITSGFTCSVSTLNDEGTVSVLVSYSGFSASFTVDVSQDEVYSLEIARLPEKVNYFLGDTLDTTKLILKARFISGAEKGIVDGFTCSPTVLETVGSQTITVTYLDCSCTYDVTVVKPELTSLKIVTMPNKLEYFDGDGLDTAGLKLLAEYENGTSKTVDAGFVCSPTTVALTNASTTAGYSEKKTITVSFEEKSTEFEVTANAVYVSKLEVVNAPNKTSGYLVGDSVDASGLVLKATLSNGKTVDSIQDGYAVSPDKLSKEGTETITVEYNGCKTTFSVQVQLKPSDWVLMSEVPNGAQIVEKKWAYDFVENMESDSSTLDGWTQTGSEWRSTGSGSTNYASFPSTFDTGNSIYTSFAKGPYEAFENATNKRTVNNRFAGYVYWHWMYNVSYANTTARMISDRKGTFDQYGTSGKGFWFGYFSAFTSTVDAPYLDKYYCCSRNQASYNCSNIMPDKSSLGTGTPRYFRFEYSESTYTDYKKVFFYTKTTPKESATEVTEGNGITNVRVYVKYVG